MVKRIHLVLEDDKFRQLRKFKNALSADKAKKDLTWEDFLCDWVLNVFGLWQKKIFDKAVDEALKQLDSSFHETFIGVVTGCVNKKLESALRVQASHTKSRPK